MATSAPNIAEREHRETPSSVAQKAKTLAKAITSSKHFIVFTGAGISTSAGVPDFRGPDGAWTLRAQGKVRPDGSAVSTLQAVPSSTHMALVELQNRGILKFLVSQNSDGLHRRSGILPGTISELHGNNNREYCKSCGKEYLRDFRAVATYEKTVRDHRTGRKCALCGGTLLDSIINFGEPLPEHVINLAFEHANKADLCLVLGSSLTVTPANEVPEIVGKRPRAQLAICNLHKTPLDDLSNLRIFAETDSLMIKVMEELGFSIPRFILHERLNIQSAIVTEGRYRLVLSGIDVDGTPASFLRSVKCDQSRREARSEPFELIIRANPPTEVTVELEFMGNYGEPNLQICHTLGGGDDGDEEEVQYCISYRPEEKEWEVVKQE